MSCNTCFRKSEPQQWVAVKDLDRLQEVVKRLHGPPHEEVLQAEVVQEDVATVDAQDSKGTAGKGRGCGEEGVVNEIDNSTKEGSNTVVH